MSLVPFAISVVLMPRVAIATEQERYRLLAQGLGLTGTVGIGAIVGYALLSQLVVSIVYPASFGDAARLLPLLAISMGLMGLYSILSQWWMGTGRAMFPAAGLVIGALTACGAHAALDGPVGAAGAALAMGLGASAAIVVLGTATMWEWARLRGNGAAGRG